jgi:predicted transcriptional regulator
LPGNRRYTGVRFESANRRRLVETKDTVRAVLDRLPDDCTLDDVLYHLYVVQTIARGRADVQAGRTLSQEQVAEELRRKWLVAAEK